MKSKSMKSIAAGLILAAVTPVAAHADSRIAEGAAIYSASGQRIGNVYHVSGDGSVQLILDGNLVTLSSRDVSLAGGKVISNRSKAQLLGA